MTTSVVNNSVFRGFFEKQKLTGPNFIDWYRQLRIVLSVEDKLDYLEQPIPPALVPAQAGQQVAPEALAAHTAWVKGSKEIAGLMLMTMEPDIQWNLENLGAYEMLQELKTLFAQQAEQELLQTIFTPVNRKKGSQLALCYYRSAQGIDGCVQNYIPDSQGGGGTLEEECPRTCRVAKDTKKNAAWSWVVVSGSKGNAIPRDVILKIDLSNFMQMKVLYITVSNQKSQAIDLGLSYSLWHCRLGHISKKGNAIEKLQHDGLLNSTDLRAFEKYVPCMSGKMARNPYTTSSERAPKTFLGLIHTDVLWPI
ncbi:zinc finger, CCHC-type containing protein [Tanacetum coccineum]|uniref:Zinc finger, CCHC-type containing protein n=1 Tax=Tanacetum coccineum TaxID=301880 RepID=A0ABQ5BFL8_9ASTR